MSDDASPDREPEDDPESIAHTGARGEPRAELPADGPTSTTEWLEDPQKVHEDALSRYGLIGGKLAEALQEEAPRGAEEPSPDVWEDSAQTGDDDEQEMSERLWQFWMFTYGHLSLLPYIFLEHLPPGFAENINDPAASTAAFTSYMFRRYEVIVDEELLRREYPEEF